MFRSGARCGMVPRKPERSIDAGDTTASYRGRPPQRPHAARRARHNPESHSPQGRRNQTVPSAHQSVLMAPSLQRRAMDTPAQCTPPALCFSETRTNRDEDTTALRCPTWTSRRRPPPRRRTKMVPPQPQPLYSARSAEHRFRPLAMASSSPQPLRPRRSRHDLSTGITPPHTRTPTTAFHGGLLPSQVFEN